MRASIPHAAMTLSRVMACLPFTPRNFVAVATFPSIEPCPLTEHTPLGRGSMLAMHAH